jgi:hypothetical protein
VTKWGEFSPVGRVFTLESFFSENCRNSPKFRDIFSQKICLSISTKMSWATFWATFSQNNLVTLAHKQRSTTLLHVLADGESFA